MSEVVEKGMTAVEFYSRQSFFVARFSYYHLQELIYWSLDKEMARDLARSLSYINGSGSRARGFEYGYYPIDEVRDDINNSQTNNILGFECKPGMSKHEIAHHFHNKNFPGDTFSFDRYYGERFEGLVRKHNSVILALMNICIAMEKQHAYLTNKEM